MSEEDEVYLVPSDINGAAAGDVRVLRNGERGDDAPSLSMPIGMILEVIALPKAVSISKCKCLVVDCTSKDQGWTNFEREFNGTYRSSSTWSEVVVGKPAHQTSDGGCSPGDSDDKERGTSDAQSDDCDVVEPSNTVLQEEAGETAELTRARVCYNVRASNTLRHHRRYFKDPGGLIQHIKPANTVVLVLRSAFPGWENTANYGRLEAFFSLDFSPNSSAADISSTTSLPLTIDDFSNPALPNSCHVQ